MNSLRTLKKNIAVDMDFRLTIHYLVIFRTMTNLKKGQ